MKETQHNQISSQREWKLANKYAAGRPEQQSQSQNGLQDLSWRQVPAAAGFAMSEKS